MSSNSPEACSRRWAPPRRRLGWRGAWRSFVPPLVRQQERSDCGPAALLSVLRYWGGDESLAAVREMCATDARGTSLLGLRDAAAALGFEARGATGDFDELARESMPCIALLRLKDGRTHFVVVYRIRGDRIWVGDPSRGRFRQSRKGFEVRWRSRCVLLLRPGRLIRRNSPIPWTVWLLKYLKKEPIWLVQSLFLGMLASSLGVATALFIELLVDRYIPRRDVAMILGTGIALLLFVSTAGLARYVRQRFLVDLNRAVSDRVNEDFVAHLFDLPLRFFESRATGDITTRIADGVRIEQGLLRIGGVAVIDGLVVLVSIVGLVVVAPELAAIASICVPLYTVVLVRAAVPLRVRHAAALAAYGTVESRYIDCIRGIGDILGFGASRQFADSNAAAHRNFTERVALLGRTHAGIALLSELAGGTLLILSLTWGALHVVAQELLLGELMAGYSLLAGLIPSTERIVRASAELQETAASAERFRDLLLTPTPAPIRPAASPLSIRRELRVEGLSMRWARGERLFQRLHFQIPVGRVTGLVGANGAGKTTLVRLLNRTYAWTSGAILADGVPVESHPLSEYRASVSAFHAETHIFSGSIADNVLLGRFEADHSNPLRELERRGFSEFLGRFPSGWLEVVGEGGRRLSHGERQVIGLMRALVGDPRVLLVDEALAGTDPETGGLILHTILKLAPERAVLLISHDPRVLAKVDHLLLLEQGEIRAEGRPDALLSRFAILTPPLVRAGLGSPVDVPR